MSRQHDEAYKVDGYSELTMEDTAGEEQLRIHTQNDMDVTALNDLSTLIFGNKHQIVGKEKDCQFVAP